MYRQDHVKVMKVLGSELPKRPSFKVSEIVAAGFRREDNADRRVRNAMRKLRSDDLVEIAERGEYRLKPSGAKLTQSWNKDGWPTSSSAKKAAKKAATKKSAKSKKAPKKAVTKKAAKKAAAKKPIAKKAAKKASPARAPRRTRPAKEAPETTGGNGVSEVPQKPASAPAAQLSW
jgi:hypothetical protein